MEARCNTEKFCKIYIDRQFHFRKFWLGVTLKRNLSKSKNYFAFCTYANSSERNFSNKEIFLLENHIHNKKLQVLAYPFTSLFQIYNFVKTEFKNSFFFLSFQCIYFLVQYKEHMSVKAADSTMISHGCVQCKYFYLIFFAILATLRNKEKLCNK